MSDAADVVLRFLDLLQTGHADQAVPLLDEQVVWRNTGLPTLRGARRIGSALLLMERRGIRFSADLPHVATDDADPGFVLTERTDHLAIGRFQASFWVCGTFEVREGRIVLWDDHFAAGNVLVGTLKGLTGLLGGRGA
jgi:limonene-1,2-epoxide hydrolase